MTELKKPPVVKEGDILKQIVQYLRLKGWFVIRHHQTMGCHKGLSDLTAIKNGETVYIEVKTPTGRLSPWQIGFRDEVEGHGARYVVARSIADVEELG